MAPLLNQPIQDGGPLAQLVSAVVLVVLRLKSGRLC